MTSLQFFTVQSVLHVWINLLDSRVHPIIDCRSEDVLVIPAGIEKAHVIRELDKNPR